MIGERPGQSFPEPMVNFLIGTLVLVGRSLPRHQIILSGCQIMRARLVVGHIIRQTAGQIGSNQLSPRLRPDGETGITRSS